MQLTEAHTDTAQQNRQLVLQAFATLHAPLGGAAGDVYAPDARFLGPGRAIWSESFGAPAGEAAGVVAHPCLDIERIETQGDRVLTHATIREPGPVAGAANAKALFVHRVADGRITEVFSLLRQQ